MKKINKLFTLLLASSVIFLACSESGDDGSSFVEAEMMSDIPANVNPITSTSRGPIANVAGDTASDGSFTYFDLESGRAIETSSSADWDIAFGGTEILANSENGGGITKVSGEYTSIETATETGFSASNNDWYTYTGESPNGPKHAILPNEDETLIIKTSEGKYAKVRILSYYEGNPDTDSPEFANFQTRPAGRYFTFDYALQTNGSTSLIHVDDYTYIDLETGETVEDASSSQWDIGLKGTEIIANTENNGGIQELSIAFSSLTEAPVSGYGASNSSWYNYTGEAPSGAQHAILPKENVTLVLKTPNELYAKFRIISYYKGNPDITTQEFINLATRPASRYYTIEYGIQIDGSTQFE